MSIEHEEIETKRSIVVTQLCAIPILIGSLIGVGIIEFFFPNFFNYPYLKWGGWSSVQAFWPVFLWGGTVSVLASRARSPIHPKQKKLLFGFGILTSLGAGIWEELAFRWLYICFAMIAVMFTNFILGSFIIWIVLAFALWGVCMSLQEKEYLIALLCAVGAFILYLLLGNVNPQYWIYEYITVPIIHLVTFHQMDSVLYGGHDQLFVFGAILANFWFRDGHKYQGTLGYVNSWFMGLVLLYATLTYGLWTAVMIHIIYDLEFDFAMYFFMEEK